MTTEPFAWDVAVVGGGPAGIAAALALRQRGHSVAILEREAELGGVPRHCAHSPFGMREFGRVLFGHAYARRLSAEAEAAGVAVLLRCSVTALHDGGSLDITTPEGARTITARRVLLATGARETPRSARLVSGERPTGIITTGTLQQAVNLEGLRPMRRALVVGSELVSFSALLTCASAGITPVAIIDENPRITARSLFAAYPLVKRIPVHLETRILDIRGNPRVESVTLQKADGSVIEIACDGIVFTGRFTAEGSLALCGHLEVDPGTGGPVVDQYARCSDPAYFAAGNVLHPVETAGWCFREGRRIGRLIADDLAGRLPSSQGAIRLSAGKDVRYVLPQRVIPGGPDGFGDIQIRVARALGSGLVMAGGGAALWSRGGAALPERRLLAPLRTLSSLDAGSTVVVKEKEA